MCSHKNNGKLSEGSQDQEEILNRVEVRPLLCLTNEILILDLNISQTTIAFSLGKSQRNCCII